MEVGKANASSVRDRQMPQDLAVLAADGLQPLTAQPPARVK